MQRPRGENGLTPLSTGQHFHQYPTQYKAELDVRKAQTQVSPLVARKWQSRLDSRRWLSANGGLEEVHPRSRLRRGSTKPWTHSEWLGTRSKKQTASVSVKCPRNCLQNQLTIWATLYTAFFPGLLCALSQNTKDVAGWDPKGCIAMER